MRIIIVSGGPSEFCTRNAVVRTLFRTAAEEADDVWVWVEHLHHGELVEQVPLVALGGVAPQRLDRHRHRGRLGAEAGHALGGLVLPHLPEAALADLGDDLQLVPRELPLAVARAGPAGGARVAAAGAFPVAVGIGAAVVRESARRIFVSKEASV